METGGRGQGRRDGREGKGTAGRRRRKEGREGKEKGKGRGGRPVFRGGGLRGLKPPRKVYLC